MIRLYRETLEHILLMLLYLRDNCTLWTTQNYEAYIRDTWLPPKVNVLPAPTGLRKLVSCVQGIVLLNNKAPVEPSDIIEDLRAALTKNEESFQDRDLISQMVDLLGLPYSVNMIDRGTLEEFRKAFLIPEEVAKLTSRLAHKDATCPNCDHRFSNGELITYVKNTREIILYCTTCMNPSFVACTKCPNSLLINKKLASALRQVQCEEHHMDGEKPNASTEAAVPVVTTGRIIYTPTPGTS